MAAHPSLPVILCSDGYLLSVIELSYNLTRLVMYLTEQCRVEQKTAMSLVDLSRHRLLNDISNMVDSVNRDFPIPAKNYDVVSDDCSKLCTAFCLLLTSEQFSPHHGFYPSSKDSGEVLQVAELIVSLIGNVPMSSLTSLALRLLELMPLDVYHSHYSLYADLLSCYLYACVTELGDVLYSGNNSKQSTGNNKELIDTYSTRVSNIVSFIKYVIELVNSEYGISCHGAAPSTFSFLLPSLRCLVKQISSFVHQLKQASHKAGISELVKKSASISLQVLRFAKYWITLLTCTKESCKRPLKGT